MFMNNVQIVVVSQQRGKLWDYLYIVFELSGKINYGLYTKQLEENLTDSNNCNLELQIQVMLTN